MDFAHAEAQNSAPPASEQHLVFLVPRATNPREFALLSAGELELGPRVVLAAEGGRFARAATTGCEELHIGVDAQTGTLLGGGPVELKQGSHVHGDVTSAARVERRSGAIVDGAVKENIPLLTQQVDWKVTFPSSPLPTIRVDHDHTSAPIAPGYYRGLQLGTRSTVTLVAGTYYFDDFDVGQGAVVRLDNDKGRISIFVRSTLDLDGDFQAAGTTAPDMILGYLASSGIEVKGHFAGTLLAPKAEIEVQRPRSGVHDASFIGKEIRVSPDVRIVHTPGSSLIQAVTVDKTQVCSGESVTVSVEASNPFGGDPPTVTINQKPGARQILQFDGTGSRAIAISVGAAGFVESRVVFVTVIACGATPPKPTLLSTANQFHEGTVDLSIENAESFMDPSASYHWDFGDGTASDTSVPAISHSYIAALDRDREHNNFDVTLTVHRSGSTDVTATNTVSVWNAYAFQKARGVIAPRVHPLESSLQISGASIVARAGIENVEDQALALSSRRVDLQPCDPLAEPRYGADTPVSIAVGARASAQVDVSLATADLTSVCSVAVYLFGATPDGKRVTGSVYFNVQQPANTQREVLPPAAAAILDYVADHALVANPQSITDEELMHVAMARQIPEDLAFGRGPLPAKVPSSARAKAADGVVGQPCVPGDTPPADEKVSCQRVGWSKEGIAEIANALRGDILMSRGCGFIGTLLAQVTPPQKWSHTGIMVQNYRRIAQSTGLDEYLEKNTDGSLFGKPVPFDGFQEHALRYVWPGTFESSVQQAYEIGLEVDGPDGNKYGVRGFSYSSKRCEGPEIVYPMVLKPTPDKAQAIRPTLHSLADAARQDIAGGIRGHYRFFAYTDVASNNNPSPPDWVQAKPERTMCSGVIWRAAKQLGLTVNADKSNDNNETLPDTPDGLFFYREDERKAAAQALYTSIYNKVGTGWDEGMESSFRDVKEKIGPLVYAVQPLLNIFGGVVEITSDVRDDAANQVTNCFASDDCSKSAKDSDDWKNPGTGTSVSPDDLVSWDLYGRLEPLAYHSARSVPIYEWRLSEGAGTVCGTVLLNGQPVKDATVVFSGDPVERITPADGTFTFEGVSVGHYSVRATLFQGDPMSGEQLSAEVELDVADRQVGPCVTLELQRPDINFRRVVISSGMGVHDEGDENANTSGHTELLLSPTETEKHFDDVTVCAGDESRGESHVTVRWVGSGAVHVTLDMRLYEGSCLFCDACNNNDLDGQLVREVVICDDTTSFADCDAIRVSLGLTDPSTLAVIRDYVTDFPFRIDNNDEHTGEFVNVGFEIHNFRQR
jgi:hypothetical protein